MAGMRDRRFREGFQRLQQALRGVPDRVPITAQMHEFSLAWTGGRGQEFYRQGQTLVSGILRTAEAFGFDVPSIGYDVYNIELEALGQPLIFAEHCAPVADSAAVLIASRSELERLRPPVAGKAGRMPFVLEVHRSFLEQTGVHPTIQFCAPFSLAALARGYSRFIEDICLEPSFAHELLSFFTEKVIAPWINAQKERFPGALFAVGADALCSPPMTNLQIIREFAIPYILRLRQLCPLAVSVVNWWGDSCFGDPEELLKLKLQVSAGLIRAQDPDVARLGARVFKDFALRHGVALEIGIGETVLNQGPVSAIRARIRDCLSQAAEQGRLVLYLTSLSAETPPPHVRAAIQAVKDYGLYE